MRVWGISDVGMVREMNQDAFHFERLFEDNLIICAVCDGMGGAKAGNVASQMAVSVFVGEMRRQLKPGLTPEDIRGMMAGAVAASNTAVFERSLTSHSYEGMGTTLVAVFLQNHGAVLANVGDSRIYAISPTGIRRLTRDHSVVEDLVQSGEITRDEARTHRQRNLLTRALGTERHVSCDLYEAQFQSGEYLLLCTDGLTTVLDDDTICQEVLHGGPADTCCRRLVEKANRGGGPDNITVVLVEFQ